MRNPLPDHPKASPVQVTRLGRMFNGRAETVLDAAFIKKYGGRIQLIFTSPPFPLNRKKKYGNLQGQAYIDWLRGFADTFKALLTPTGSIVLEVGNAWMPGIPVMSTLALESLLAFREAGEFHLIEQFICYNPARLPSPAQWVNVERIRVKDAFTHVWWMSPNPRPKADNRCVLRPYSGAMQSLLRKGKYNSGVRPSEHQIGEASFLRDNGGSIPSNVLTFSNTSSYDSYQLYCREHQLKPHPARMPKGLPEFFVNFLTDPGDRVLDPFAGSNTTGAIAEGLGRKWISIEPELDYILGSFGRFQPKEKPNGRSTRIPSSSASRHEQ